MAGEILKGDARTFTYYLHKTLDKYHILYYNISDNKKRRREKWKNLLKE